MFENISGSRRTVSAPNCPDNINQTVALNIKTYLPLYDIHIYKSCISDHFSYTESLGMSSLITFFIIFSLLYAVISKKTTIYDQKRV